MAYKIQSGYNKHEVVLIPKSSKKIVFLKNFFNFSVNLVFYNVILVVFDFLKKDLCWGVSYLNQNY